MKDLKLRILLILLAPVLWIYPADAAPQSVGSVGTVAALRTGIFIANQYVGGLQLLGYYTAGDGGGGPLTVSASTSCSDNGATIFKDLAGHCITRASLQGLLNVKMAGAKCDSTGPGVGTDDTVRLNAAETARVAAGMSGLYFPAFCFVNEGTVAPTGSGIWEGAGASISGITFVDGSAHDAAIQYLGATAINFELRHFGIIGNWNADHTDTGARNVTIIGANNLKFVDVECSYSTNMCLTGYGISSFTVEGSYVHHSARDGMNCENCQAGTIANYREVHGGDDCIAWSSDQSATNPVRGGVSISGVYCEDTYGLKLLGAKGLSGSGWTLRRPKGYCFDVTVAPSFNEGFTSGVGQSITGVSCTDVINLNLFGGGTVNNYFTIGSAYQAGSGNPVTWRSRGVAGVLAPWSYNWNNRGTSSTVNISTGQGLIFSGFTGQRTLPSGGAYADWGFNPTGETGADASKAFEASGWKNPTITEDSLNGNGIDIYNGLSHALIENGNIITGGYGLVTTSLGNADFAIDQVTVRGLEMHNVLAGGFNTNVSAGTKVNMEIYGNKIDCDPLGISASRGASGTWSNTTAPSALDLSNAIGVSEGGNIFSNCSRGVTSNGTSVIAHPQKDIYQGDFAGVGYNAGNQGIGNIPQGEHYTIVASNTANVAFGSMTFDDYEWATTIPTSGQWVAGTFVQNVAPAACSASTQLYGWSRLTTGSGNVSGTDWLPVKLAC